MPSTLFPWASVALRTHLTWESWGSGGEPLTWAHRSVRERGPSASPLGLWAAHLGAWYRCHTLAKPRDHLAVSGYGVEGLGSEHSGEGVLPSEQGLWPAEADFLEWAGGRGGASGH